ncbi:MAG TPA: PUA domain-containing protein [Nitrosopumilaceae archaeon]|nr:PUA domain-containing protein [Nitrosopumilaceae archaeon]
MDSILKIKYTLDALFGNGVSKHLPKEIKFTYSKRTGRIQHMFQNETLLCTLRIDGGLAITPYFAQILLKNKKFKENCVEVDADSKPFVEKGSSVFCKHVVWCGKNILIGADVPVLYEDTVIAVGRAVLSSRMIKSLKRGVAVKIRDSLKSTG